MALKEGPNFEDENRIKEWLAEGASVPKIAQNLGIKVPGVAAFVESLDVDYEPEDDEEE